MLTVTSMFTMAVLAAATGAESANAADASSSASAEQATEQSGEELEAQREAERDDRDPLFRTDLDISFTYGNVRGPQGPQIYGGYLHWRAGLKIWSGAKAAGRIDLGIMAGYRAAPFPDRHPDLPREVMQSGMAHRPFVWGTLGHTFYFTPARKVALGVHGAFGWSNYTLDYDFKDPGNATYDRLLETSNVITWAVHGNLAFALGPRSGIFFNGTYVVPTEPVVAPWSVGVGLNVKLN